MNSLTPAQRDRKIDALRELEMMIRAFPIVTPCDQCAFFDPQTGHCQRWDATVPVEARAAGCGEWAEGVPF